MTSIRWIDGYGVYWSNGFVQSQVERNIDWWNLYLDENETKTEALNDDQSTVQVVMAFSRRLGL